MPSLILPSRPTQQPQQFVPLDRSNRIAAGALAVITPTIDINWATGKQLTRGGSGYALSSLGGMQTLVHRQNNYVETETLPIIGTRSYVLWWLGWPVATGTSGSSVEPSFVVGATSAQIGICMNTGSNRSVSVGSGGVNNFNNWGCSNNTWSSSIYGSSEAIPNFGLTSGKPVLLMVVRNQNSLDFWRDGVMVKSLPIATSNISGAFKLISGSFVEGTAWYVSANTAMCGLSVLPSDATPTELQAFSANTWGTLWGSQPRRLWAASSGSAPVDTPVNPAAGALALTGFAPTIARSANQGVTPAAGALALTSFAPVVTQSITTNVSPGAGALSLSGYAPAVTQSSTMSVAPQVGALTLAGYAPTIARTTNGSVSPGAGSLTLTGYAPTVARTANLSVQPGAGGLTLTGFAPLIFQGPDNAPRVYAATIMRITTTNRRSDLGAMLNASAPIRSTGPNVATIMSTAPVNRAADLGSATLNRTVSFP